MITKDRREWHKWFAWYPVEFGGRIVWLETIERRLRCGYYSATWGYRLTEEQVKSFKKLNK